VCGLFVVAWSLTSGCEKDVPTVRVRNPWLGGMRVAVAPALNFSGSSDFDREAVADLMASELSHVDGFEVIPVSRVLAVLAWQEREGIESPTHALEVRQALGADAILVFAVTEYDPYIPPVVGIAAQLYGTFPGEAFTGVDPVRVSRSAAPLSERPVASSNEPLAQTTRVFNAAHEPTAVEVKAFAKLRDADESPFGWRKYMVSQQHYLRFCCQATIKELVQNGVSRRVATNSS
jgi:hypothetical protein